MRSIIAAAAALVLSAGVALAQAGDSRPMHNGGYLGVVAGYSTSSLNTPAFDAATAGAQGGLVAGWGVVGRSGLYLGLEADAVLKDIKWSVGDAAGTASASNQWVGSLRGRLGYSVGPFLIYGTGGGAITEQRISVSGFGSESDWRWGMVGGGGIETHVTQTMAIRVEGLHYVFPEKNFWFSGDSAKIGVGETVARVGITFKLN